MSKTLRVLVVEDSATDAELTVRALQRGGYNVEHRVVETGETMRDALRSPWDVVLSDWAMPTFSAREALAIVAEAKLDIPFIILSGTIDEETAVEALRAGAQDFVLKGRLARLAPAIERGMRECAAREAARRAEQRFARLADCGIIGIAFADTLGNVHDANDAYFRMFGYTRDDLATGAMGWAATTPPEWAGADALATEQLMSTGVAVPWEKEMLRKDGSRAQVLVGVALLDPPNCIAFVADLSARKRAEAALRSSQEQFLQAQKMEAIGRVAGGVAHDFNNLLSVILSYTDLAIETLGQGDPLRGDLMEVRKAGERAASLTQQLLALSRRQVLQPRIVDLNDVVGNMEKILRRVIGEDIELVIKLGAALGRVKVDPGQIEQVVMNLAVNARDAMPRGGKLTLETRNAQRDASAAARLGIAPGAHVVLAMGDTGSGIDPAVADRIFEPFFTTKHVGKGTGLGLSTVLGIVQQSGGAVTVDSKPGAGTTFEISLPSMGCVSTEAYRPAAKSAGELRGNETILLVEDDASVRALGRTILQRHGYEVLEAQGGGDALILSEQYRESIDLLVTDVVMPRMSGRQLAERLRPLRPKMRVLYMSGHTDDAVVRHGVLESHVVFLQKPITADVLLRKVREVLDTPVR